MSTTMTQGERLAAAAAAEATAKINTAWTEYRRLLALPDDPVNDAAFAAVLPVLGKPITDIDADRLALKTWTDELRKVASQDDEDGMWKRAHEAQVAVESAKAAYEAVLPERNRTANAAAEFHDRQNTVHKRLEKMKREHPDLIDADVPPKPIQNSFAPPKEERHNPGRLPPGAKRPEPPPRVYIGQTPQGMRSGHQPGFHEVAR